MTISPDRCQQLRKLHVQLTNQIQLLRENIQKEEHEGVDTSSESLNILKHLQSSLGKIMLELEQCPPDKDAIAPSAPLSTSAIRSTRAWYPDAEDSGSSENERDLLIDEE